MRELDEKIAAWRDQLTAELPGQPETVRDYELSYRAPDTKEWVNLGTFTGNYQRLRRQNFAPFKAAALRLKITATNGARITNSGGPGSTAATTPKSLTARAPPTATPFAERR